jgi:hypothetical protein
MRETSNTEKTGAHSDFPAVLALFPSDRWQANASFFATYLMYLLQHTSLADDAPLNRHASVCSWGIRDKPIAVKKAANEMGPELVPELRERQPERLLWHDTLLGKVT